MRRHRLGCVLDAADRVEPTVDSQGIVSRPMAGRDAGDARDVPGQHGIQQTHRTFMRDQSRNTGSVQQ